MMRNLLLILTVSLLSACGGGKKVHFAQEGSTLSKKPEVSNSQFLKEIWDTNVGSGFNAENNVLTPAISDTTVFSASVDGTVSAIDIASGDFLWRVELDTDLTAGVGIGDGLLFLASRQGQLLAISQSDGTQQWTTVLENEVLAQPAVTSGVVVVRVGDDIVTGLDTANGDVLWRQEKSIAALSVRGVSRPLINGRGAVAGLADGSLLALDVDSGDVLWETAVGRPRGNNEMRRLSDIDADPVLFGTVLYVASYQSRIVAMAMGSPRVIWSRDLSTLKTPAVDADHLYITEQSGSLIALNRYSGEFAWELDSLQGRGLSSAVSIGEYLFVGDYEGNFYRIDRNTGKLIDRQKVPGGAVLLGPKRVGSSLLIMSENGRLALYSVAP
jgi:outer membrane protein assembly factor BamB